jgi:2-keto-3-deoxy-L-rhamnonate aldolase RhmA
MTILKNHTKEKLAAGGLALGIGLRQARHVDIATIAKTCGYDWLFVDMEHSSLDLDMASQLCMAGLHAGVTPFVRVPGPQHFHASRILDTGAMGIIVPHVESVAEARQAVDNCKYPPIGHRSYGGTVPQVSFTALGNVKHQEVVNEQTMVVVMVESPKAVDDIDAIAAVEGIDVLLIGTNDLSNEMGVPGDYTHPKIVHAYDAVCGAAKKHGITAAMGGIYDEELVKQYVAKGIRMILGGSDLSFLMKAASDRSKFLRTLE